jgi:hypothetical protein
MAESLFAEEETSEELERIEEEREATKKMLSEASREKVIDGQYMTSLANRIKQLDNLAEIENPAITARALEILRTGDPVEYILGVYGRLHVGDIEIGKVLLLSIANQSVLNSEGLQPKLSGPSGKGKTHAAKAMYHLIPDVGYKLEGSLSAKSLFYHPDLKPGTIVFSDDIRMNAELEDTLKRAMSNFQQKTTHMTVSKDLKSQSLEIPERIAWWLTSVESQYGVELLNRLFGLDVDDSVDQDDAVTKQQLGRAKYGEVALPEDEDVKVCRSIINEVKKKIFTVIIPYSDMIEWKGAGDRRNLPRFLDLIRGFAVLRFMQRPDMGDNEILASLKDFDDAKALYELGKTGLATKLTKTDLKLVTWMTGKGPLSTNDIVKEYRKSNGGQYTPEAIRKRLEGEKGGKGLTDKIPGMLVHGSGGKGDEKKYEIPSFEDGSSLEVVSLKPEAYERFADGPTFVPTS